MYKNGNDLLGCARDTDKWMIARQVVDLARAGGVRGMISNVGPPGDNASGCIAYNCNKTGSS